MNYSMITPKTAPSAWLDLDALDANISIVNAKTANMNLRVATKSLRSIDVLKYIEKNSPNFLGLMSYTAEESVYLLEQGFDNILCAYPTFDIQALIQTFAYTEKGATMIWMVDCIEHWQCLDRLAKEHHTTIDICLDINLSMTLPTLYFGTKRSSLMHKKHFKKLLQQGKKFKHSKIMSVMGYEAQIAGLPETSPDKPLLATPLRLLKHRSKKQVSKRRRGVVHWLKNQGIDIQLVNGGGSGSMDFTCAQPEVTEITVGSAYYHPALFSYMDSMADFTPAAGFVLQVTRQPENKVITCHSGGFIASGCLGQDKQPVIHYPQNLSILPQEGFGEVQTPMAIKGRQTVKIGNFVWCRHAKAGELCEQFNTLDVYRNSIAVDSFTTYRGDGKAFH